MTTVYEVFLNDYDTETIGMYSTRELAQSVANQLNVGRLDFERYEIVEHELDSVTDVHHTVTVEMSEDGRVLTTELESSTFDYVEFLPNFCHGYTNADDSGTQALSWILWVEVPGDDVTAAVAYADALRQKFLAVREWPQIETGNDDKNLYKRSAVWQEAVNVLHEVDAQN